MFSIQKTENYKEDKVTVKRIIKPREEVLWKVERKKLAVRTRAAFRNSAKISTKSTVKNTRTTKKRDEGLKSVLINMQKRRNKNK